jgi:hypothetical protein
LAPVQPEWEGRVFSIDATLYQFPEIASSPWVGTRDSPGASVFVVMEGEQLTSALGVNPIGPNVDALSDEVPLKMGGNPK